MKRLLACMSFLIMGQIQAQQQFTVYFDFDIDEADKQSNKKLYDWIKENPHAVVSKICGYTDSVGEAIYNTDLSERRAAYIYNLLKENGFSVDDAEKIGYGETKATGKSIKDRKVVIHYSVSPSINELPVQEKDPTAFAKKVADAEKGDKIVIPNLNFYNNTDIMLNTSKPVLRELLDILQKNPVLKIDIQGHICCQKKEENEISLKRAVLVYKFLINNGIAKDRLSYKSFGSSRPIHPLPEKNEEERIANRRVEIEILDN
ncbi:OmpA family protein [Flavobacterium sp. Sd200]|uniref:OmpA family protein n=1 Tax=Flavobacterium sp. Sd200 TaxID=2692211 RepID=UPI00136B84F2|nr:OmpA family protein [Flavobacterium sp. Sd200]MXN89799.1 OmpA family protein [Flavobacterium sp. Sd200]